MMEERTERYSVALTTVAMVRTSRKPWRRRMQGDRSSVVSARSRRLYESNIGSLKPRRLQGSLLSRHMISESGSSVPRRAPFSSPQLYICNYTHALSTRPVFLVFVSVKKILHLYLQQLNRGQLSTCVWCVCVCGGGI